MSHFEGVDFKRCSRPTQCQGLRWRGRDGDKDEGWDCGSDRPWYSDTSVFDEGLLGASGFISFTRCYSFDCNFFFFQRLASVNFQRKAEAGWGEARLAAGHRSGVVLKRFLLRAEKHNFIIWDMTEHILARWRPNSKLNVAASCLIHKPLIPLKCPVHNTRTIIFAIDLKICGIFLLLSPGFLQLRVPFLLLRFVEILENWENNMVFILFIFPFVQRRSKGHKDTA